MLLRYPVHFIQALRPCPRGPRLSGGRPSDSETFPSHSLSARFQHGSCCLSTRACHRSRRVARARARSTDLAGVVGLTTAVEIQRALPAAAVTIFAAQTAEDLKSTRYTSSWAGAHHVTLEGPGLQRDCEVDTFKALWALAHDDPSVPLLVCPQTEVLPDRRARLLAPAIG